MKFMREDTYPVFCGDWPVDRNHPENAVKAMGLSLPTGFSDKAKAFWDYLDGAGFLFEYAGRLVLTDESLWLTAYKGNHILGGPRWVGDSWEELEEFLEVAYDVFEDSDWK